jgi:hypothetical protein
MASAHREPQMGLSKVTRISLPRPGAGGSSECRWRQPPESVHNDIRPGGGGGRWALCSGAFFSACSEPPSEALLFALKYEFAILGALSLLALLSVSKADDFVPGKMDEEALRLLRMMSRALPLGTTTLQEIAAEFDVAKRSGFTF